VSGESAEVLITVSIPVEAIPGDVETSEITFNSQGNPAQSESPSVSTSAVLLEGPMVNPENSTVYGDLGQTITHTLVVTNAGYATDTYEILVNSAVWPTQAPLSVGPLAVGESTSVEVLVSIPAEVMAGESDTSLITFNSQLPGTMPASAIVSTIANAAYGLEATAEVTSLEASAAGTPLTYTLTITNLGNISDTFDISLISSDWSSQAPLAVGPLAAGEATQVTVIIYVPLEAHSGDTSLITVTFTSQGNPLVQQAMELTAAAGWYNLFMPFTSK
jgi:uncharacterized membrane protein